MANLVEVRNLRVEAVTDAGRVMSIIDDVSFDIADGEIVALIGESGSGKTTIALTLMGYTRPDCRISGGSVRLGSHDMAKLDESECARIRGVEVAYIPQSAAAAFNPAHTIMDQVIEVVRIHNLMPARNARAKAIELFKALALPHPETIGDRYPHQVSGGQLQRLAAAMALIGDPKLIIFDEPTTALDVTTQIEVLRAFKAVMQGKKIAGVYVSHDLAVVAQMADRIVVLKGGAIQETGATEQIIKSPSHPYTKALIDAVEPALFTGLNVKEEAKEPLLEVADLYAGYGGFGENGQPRLLAVKHVDLRVPAGHNLGIIGESGCGKSTLARAIAGLLPAVTGNIKLEGKALPPYARHRSREELRKVQIVFQSADTALNPVKSVSEILERPLVFYHGMARRDRAKRVDELLDMVRLPRALGSRRPSELSGGQKQRVNFARALAADPKLILCDEITSALDTVVAAAIIDLLKELQRELALSYIFISHDLSTVRAICDDVAVMYAGEKVEQTSPDKIGRTGGHPYARLLFDSVPKLDRGWLDSLKQDEALIEAYAVR
ncbi:ABC transporter ATP-binding protein [Pseudolabrys sp. FHR47]|uniref:ABC transporter ATP-binding protein n=1 Tax=Pseudolabrys sp. FHR47 TaxID=2562284 RepID=UPI0010BEAF4A|nr:ABC transporter ATP-binding protein [Pseudolabrys sp. FHR47]